jgi:glucokinase
MVRVAKLLLKEKKVDSSLRNKEFTAKDIIDAAREGDVIGKQVLEQAGFYLGLALADVGATLDPELLVIGGGVSAAGEILREAAEQGYRTQTFHACAQTPIKLASLGNLAGIYGCMAMLF